MAAEDLTRPCKKCGLVKLLSEFPLRNGGYRRGDCHSCFGRRNRQYKRDPEKAARSNEKRRPKNRLYNRGYMAAKRARNVAIGKPAQGNWHDRLPEYVARAAKNGKEFWPHGCGIQRAVVSKLVPKIRARKPWAGLSDTDAYRTRYRLDPAFRERERVRQQFKRHANPRYALQWAKDGRRWYRAAMSDDGSVTFEVLRYLRQALTCAYCECELVPRNREVDHVQPLAQGGTHTADNLVMACKACNRRKGKTGFLQWIQGLTGPSDKGRTRVGGTPETCDISIV